MTSLPSTQKGVALAAKRQPLIEIEAPVTPPEDGEVVVRVQWTASTPLDLHLADGGLLISEYPYLTGGGGAAGTVVAVGPGGDLKGLRVGDTVMSFAFRGGKEANHQEFITIPAYLASKVPQGLSLEEAVTVPVNLVTVFHTATCDLELDLPWPLPEGWSPRDADKPIVVWGAASSVGMYAVQVFRHWGYTNVIAVASGKHHEYLKSIGATACFDYRESTVTDDILAHVESRGAGRHIPWIIDCIGSLDGTIRPITRLAGAGTRVAIMLPIILKDATEDQEPEYEMDASRVLVDEWAEGVVVRGTRTHFYLQNEYYKQALQPEIVPALLEQGIVSPNRYRVVEGETVVERAEEALRLLRRREVSGERLVWSVAE